MQGSRRIYASFPWHAILYDTHFFKYQYFTIVPDILTGKDGNVRKNDKLNTNTSDISQVFEVDDIFIFWMDTSGLIWG
jgi:hypothetical protein